MRKYNFYKHDLSTDMVVEPIRIIYLHNPERIKVTAKLYTTGYPGKIHYLDKAEWTILNSNKQWKSWSLSNIRGFSGS